uniref:Uncharacterized protein n=1 Tax=Zea mays TaxID=4577 RepID=A0A804REX7_MAIZE
MASSKPAPSPFSPAPSSKLNASRAPCSCLPHGCAHELPLSHGAQKRALKPAPFPTPRQAVARLGPTPLLGQQPWRPSPSSLWASSSISLLHGSSSSFPWRLHLQLRPAAMAPKLSAPSLSNAAAHELAPSLLFPVTARKHRISRPLSGLGGAAPPLLSPPRRPFEMAPNSPSTFPTSSRCHCCARAMCSAKCRGRRVVAAPSTLTGWSLFCAAPNRAVETRASGRRRALPVR